MLKSIFSLLLAFICLQALAQNKTTVKGIVADSASKAPMEFATVAVVNAKDTSLVSYTLTDKNGTFKLSGIAVDKPVKIIISFVGYNTIRQNLHLQKELITDLKTIYLSGNTLMDVIISGERSPVTVKKDTIEFNTEAFKTRPNAVVEELLKKLPGVQVNVDGSILVNGKSISKLLIDGKQFFGDDPIVATKNLDADLVAKIQVYDDRENDPDHLVSNSEVSKIINLKLKSKIKKSTLGKVYAGGGSRDRYEAGGILSNFRDTLQVSLIGLANNLNRTGFSGQELYTMGGFDRSGGGGQIYDGTFGGRGYGGIESVASGGVNINNNYGKKLKLNLTYFFTHSDNLYNGTNYIEQTVANTTLINNSRNMSNNKSNKHAIGGLVEWVPDTMMRIRYEPRVNLNYQNNRNENSNSSSNSLLPRLSESAGLNTSNANNNGFSHNFMYYRRLKKKGESINITHSLQLNSNNNEDFNKFRLESFSAEVRSETQDRFREGWNKSNSGDLSVTYNYPLSKKLTLELNSGTRFYSNMDLASTFEYNPSTMLYDFFLTNLSNDLQRNVFIQSLRPQLFYKITKDYSLRVSVKGEYQDVRNEFNFGYEDINRKYYNFYPSFRFDAPSFSLSYDERLDLPGISQMQPIARQYNQLYTAIGNPDLRANLVRTLNLNVYKYIPSKQINFNLYSGYIFSNNGVLQRSNVNSAGATVASFVNRGGYRNGYLGMSVGKQFKKSQKWQVGLNTSARTNLNQRPFILNADEGFQNSLDIGFGENINLNYGDLLSLNAKYDFYKQMTRYKDVDFAKVNTYTHSAGGEFSLRWPKRIILDANYTYFYNPQIGQGFQRSSHQLNLALSIQMLKKDRGQLKLSVYDLFDQNISINRYAFNNAIGISDRNILRRYFLATYQYKLNVYKK